MNSLLSIENLHVKYGNIEVLKGINMEIKEGSIVALLGANGAGKTTTLKKISGFLNASEGKIIYRNDDITKKQPERIARMKIVHAPEGRQIFQDLTVEENLRIGAFTIQNFKLIEEKFRMVYHYFPILEQRKIQVAATLSGGEQQMLAIGRALMANPKLLLLDEPSLGLAPLIVKEIFMIIKEIVKNGTTVLIVEQNALQTLKIADYAYVLEIGKINIEGKASDLIQNPKLVESYLGKTK